MRKSCAFNISLTLFRGFLHSIYAVMQCFLAKPTIALLNHEASRSSMDFITNHFRHTTEIMQWSNSSALYKAAHDGYNIVLWCQKKHKKQQPIVIIKSFLYVFLAQRCEVLVHIQYSTRSCYLGQRDKLPVLWTSDHPKLINCAWQSNSGACYTEMWRLHGFSRS